MTLSWASGAPVDAGFAAAAEWVEHEAVWSAWPHHPDWGAELPAAQDEAAELFRAIADEGRGERVRVLVRDPALREAAAVHLGGPGIELVEGPYGDLWLRDTGPVFVRDAAGEVAPVCFRFNGWGEKFRMAGDESTSEAVAILSGAARGYRRALVLEGGSVELDGEGTVLTTRQCLLHPSRNPGCDVRAIEAELRCAFGVEAVLWLGEGLLNDHTDGHVDNLARFVAPGRVVCMAPSGPSDPNRERLEAVRRDLEAMDDARGRPLEVVTIPSPGAVRDHEGALLPASYVNFYVANTRVVVPTFGVENDAAAVAALADLFPGREVVGRSARALLGGGGAFHCITQPEPRSGPRRTST